MHSLKSTIARIQELLDRMELTEAQKADWKDVIDALETIQENL